MSYTQQKYIVYMLLETGVDDYKSLGHLIFLSDYVCEYYNKINITNYVSALSSFAGLYKANHCCNSLDWEHNVT